MKKEKIKTILNDLSKITDRPIDKKGNLDIEAFNKLPEVIQGIKRLKELKVTKKWLWGNGFMVAGMLLKI